MSDVDCYDYHLPEELIAQHPLETRSDARLLCVNRENGDMGHRYIRDLPDMLRPDDLVIVNDTRVVPARLVGRREATGGKWEGLFLRADAQSGTWQILARTRGRPKVGERIVLFDRSQQESLALILVARGQGGTWIVQPTVSGHLDAMLEQVGRVPLPSYIRGGVEQDTDENRYQTVFANTSGSAAAPTAGLHFTAALLESLRHRNIRLASVTLHVGVDTFRPITSDRLEDHAMHTEWCACPDETVAAIQETRDRGGRVIAVGTTAVRTLETAAKHSPAGELSAWLGPTDLFIKPGFSFQIVDCLLTNFHMPRTTLMVLVSTFASRELIQRTYEEAVRQQYRFLSYGDAMLIE
ncbi:MAG: tRNA preQ1(34) S-adenosylmethionine ribosyltransferase-isomerase QueA [Pirellulales bacterium]